MDKYEYIVEINTDRSVEGGRREIRRSYCVGNRRKQAKAIVREACRELRALEAEED